MSSGGETGQQRIAQRLAGQHILVTGSTGFLAKAFIEKLLRAVPTIAGLHLMIRPRAGGAPPGKRLEREVLGSHAFDRLRASMGDGFRELCRERVHVVAGDLSRERFGLEEQAYAELAAKITLIVNSAATVTFDERLDLAVELNSLGPSRLLQLARDAGNMPFLHVSTCYVCGVRRGDVVEDFSAPEPARERLPRSAETGAYDLDRLVESLREEARAVCAGMDADSEECRRKLIDAGMARARSLGWNDTYTFTKWIGEQLLVRDRGTVPLAIFRPAIIESSYDEPTPGWIDGLRMADPMIAAYGKGKLAQFPARADVPLDLIPVDLVANAMIATLPIGQPGGEPALYQCASSGRNPLMVAALRQYLAAAFARRPMNDDTGRPVYPALMELVDAQAFLRGLEQKQRRIRTLRGWLERIGAARATVRKLSYAVRQLEQLAYFVKIYTPYTHLDCRFADDNLRAAAQRLHPDDREMFPFDVAPIDWEDYVVNRHVPGLRAFVLGTGGEPSARIRAVEAVAHRDTVAGQETLQAANLFEVFRRAAERFPDKAAFQVRRETRWLRYTYDEALRATGTIMRRFQELGLAPGDRVSICAENGPEWALCYLAAMRAGLTAVPLDPQLPPGEAWACARFAECRLMLAGRSTLNPLKALRRDEDCPLVHMAEPFVPPPAASRDPAPEPAVVDGNEVASILFTSGTTVAPKAVQLSHRNFIANAAALVQVHPAYPTDEFLSVLPMYHAFEFTGGFLCPVASGATITYVDQLKGPEIRAAMQATGTTVMLVVPRLLRMFQSAVTSQFNSAGRIKRGVFRFLGGLSELTGRRFCRHLFAPVHRAFGGRLRMLVSGGSALDPELFDWFWRMGFPVYEGYGLTETAPVLTVCGPGEAKPGCVGRPLPNVEVDIRNENHEGVGEVWARGPAIMAGYLKNDAATREVIVDGWFRTGDLGRLDEEGRLYLTGRSKDLIITAAGKNVYPDEVELRYREIPYVKELCVFGMPSRDGLGDVVHAVVVVNPEAAPELDRSSLEREIRSAVEVISDTLPDHQRVAVIHFWDRELPKTTTLKAKRSLIRQAVELETVESADPGQGLASVDRAGRESAPIPKMDNPAGVQAVREMLLGQARGRATAIQPNHHLLIDLGIDSIGKIDLLGQIESCFDMRIDDARAAKVARVVDLYNLVGDRKPKTAVPREPAAAWQRRMVDSCGPVETNGSLPPALRPVRWLMRGGASAFLSSYIRVRARGVENIPVSGAFILAPNHASHLDSPAVLMAVGRKRRVWVAGAEDYFFNTAFKRFLFGKVFDTIAVDRQADGFRGLRRCGEALRRGDGLLIFPEGTRSLNGRLQPFRVGIAVLAVERQVPIVPVYIDRAYELFRKGQKIARPGVITVTFGKPVDPPALEDISDHYVTFHELTGRVEKAVQQLQAVSAK